MGNFYICSNANFPRGNAAANYIQYLALALINEGENVTIISTGKYLKQDYNSCKKEYFHRGIRYYCVENGTINRIPIYNRSGRNIIKCLEKIKISSNDIIITYGMNYHLLKPLMKYAKNINVKIYGCVTEWNQSFQYKYGVLDPNYILYKYCFDNLLTKMNGIIAISNFLKKHFDSKNCKTFVLPILADPYEYPYYNRKDKDVNTNINLIYSGQADKKDDWSSMLCSIAMLKKIEKEKIHFHLTGINRDKLVNILGKDSYLLEKLNDVLVFHSWMEYDDLIRLYYDMDYLLLMREKNVVTEANFPSKVPELLCYGIVPICSKVGDYTSYLHHEKDSFILNSSNPEEGMDVIRKILGMSPSLRNKMRNYARQTAINSFNYQVWGTLIGKYLKNEDN